VSIYQSINQSISQSASQSVNPSIHLISYNVSVVHSICLYICLSIYHVYLFSSLSVIPIVYPFVHSRIYACTVYNSIHIYYNYLPIYLANCYKCAYLAC